jgi:hypothetical protein
MIDCGLARPVWAHYDEQGSPGFMAIDWLGSGESPLSTAEESPWLLMHRDLAWIYKCLLSGEVATRNRLSLTTDQVDGHVATSGLDLSELARAGVAGLEVPDRTATALGLMAVHAVVPKDLGAVPIERIITIRERYGDDFDKWRDYMDQVGAQLTEQLAGVESPQVLDAYLREAARRYAESPTERLRQGIADVGLDTAAAAINQRFEVPAALAAAGLATANPIGLAAGAAVGVAQVRRRAKQGSGSLREASPAAYLLDIRETLAPRSWIERVIATLRNAAGLA